jgi:Universal stress protein family
LAQNTDSIAVDRSEYKEKIVAYVLSLSKGWGAEITAIHIVEPGQPLQEGGGAQTKEQTRKNKSITQAENLLDYIDTVAKRQGMNVKKEAIQPSNLLTDKKDINVKKGSPRRIRYSWKDNHRACQNKQCRSNSNRY